MLFIPLTMPTGNGTPTLTPKRHPDVPDAFFMELNKALGRLYASFEAMHAPRPCAILLWRIGVLVIWLRGSTGALRGRAKASASLEPRPDIQQYPICRFSQKIGTMPFTKSSASSEPEIGPPFPWKDFKNPKLQRYVESGGFQLRDRLIAGEEPPEYLGGGVDGFVFKVNVDEKSPVAVKIVGYGY